MATEISGRYICICIWQTLSTVHIEQKMKEMTVAKAGDTLHEFCCLRRHKLVAFRPRLTTDISCKGKLQQ